MCGGQFVPFIIQILAQNNKINRVASLQSFLTFPQRFKRIFTGLTLATVAIRNEMHDTSHCNTHIFSHNYDNYGLYATHYLA